MIPGPSESTASTQGQGLFSAQGRGLQASYNSRMSAQPQQPQQGGYNAALPTVEVGFKSDASSGYFMCFLWTIDSLTHKSTQFFLGQYIFHQQEIQTLNFQMSFKVLWGGAGRDREEKTCCRPVKTSRFTRAFMIFYECGHLNFCVACSKGSNHRFLNLLFPLCCE